jgi:hypothetical protein
MWLAWPRPAHGYRDSAGIMEGPCPGVTKDRESRIGSVSLSDLFEWGIIFASTPETVR